MRILLKNFDTRYNGAYKVKTIIDLTRFTAEIYQNLTKQIVVDWIQKYEPKGQTENFKQELLKEFFDPTVGKVPVYRMTVQDGSGDITSQLLGTSSMSKMLMLLK